MWFLLKWFFLTKCLCRYRMYFPGFERRCIDNDFALLTSWASWGEIARTVVSFERDSSCCEAAFSVHRGSVLQGQNHAVETQQSIGSIASGLPLDMLQRRLFVATNADHCGLHRPHDNTRARWPWNYPRAIYKLDCWHRWPAAGEYMAWLLRFWRCFSIYGPSNRQKTSSRIHELQVPMMHPGWIPWGDIIKNAVNIYIWIWNQSA